MSEENKDNDSEKTEDPTAHRLEEAFGKGNVAFSREITHWFMLAMSGLLLLTLTPFLSAKFTTLFTQYISHPDQFRVDEITGMLLLNTVFLDFLMILLPFSAFLMVAAIAAALVQTRLAISFKALMPQISRLSIKAGLKRLFAKKAIVEFFKGVLKLAIVTCALYVFYKSKIGDFPGFLTIRPEALLSYLSYYVLCSLFIVVGCMSFVALLDYLYQKYEHTKSLKMTKDEVKREYKQQDGDPQIKSRRRQIAHQRIRKNLTEAMGRATAIITNPTHYAIAIAYEEHIHDAPVVVAKGTDFVALRIREMAQDMKIPIVENPPLARALFASVDIEQEIPPEHYRAVAEVIRFIMTLKKQVF